MRVCISRCIDVQAISSNVYALVCISGCAVVRQMCMIEYAVVYVQNVVLLLQY
jgi:hypothetical protein